MKDDRVYLQHIRGLSLSATPRFLLPGSLSHCRAHINPRLLAVPVTTFFRGGLSNARCRAEVKQSMCRTWQRPLVGAAVHVLDRFHIMSHMNKAVDEVRRKEASAHRLKGVEVLKRSRWCLLKRPENLTDGQADTLAALLHLNLRSIRADLLKEQFQFFWTYTSPGWAVTFLDRWCTSAMRSRLVPMKKVARMLRSHRPLIINWFHARGQISAGAVEGFNNKAKLVIKRAYGFRSFRTLEIALYHTLGDLPELESTHRFC